MLTIYGCCESGNIAYTTASIINARWDCYQAGS